MNRYAFVVCSLAILFCCITATQATAQTSGKCYNFYFDWTAEGNFDGPVATWVDNNGTFINEFDEYGYWYDYKGSRTFIMDPDYGYAGIWSGKKTAGSMWYYDGSLTYGTTPGIWYMKGTKKKNCDFIFISVQSSKTGLTTGIPGRE